MFLSNFGLTREDGERWLESVCPNKRMILRPVAYINTLLTSDRNPYHKDFILTTSSPCCCDPTVELLLSDDGLDDPASQLVLLDFSDKMYVPSDLIFYFRVEYEFDGRYDGWFVPFAHCNILQPPLLPGIKLFGKIIDIGSL